MATVLRRDSASRRASSALRAAGAGDLYIELAVETPVNLSNRQRELLREFEEAGKDNNPETQDFFSRVKSFWDGMKG